MSEWISVKDRLPRNCDLVVVHLEGNTCDLAFLSALGTCSLDPPVWVARHSGKKMEGITHWMPIPAFPWSPDASVNGFKLGPAFTSLQDKLRALDEKVLGIDRIIHNHEHIGVHSRLDKLEQPHVHDSGYRLTISNLISELDARLDKLRECARRQAAWLSASDNRIDKLEHRAKNHQHLCDVPGSGTVFGSKTGTPIDDEE